MPPHVPPDTLFYTSMQSAAVFAVKPTYPALRRSLVCLVAVLCEPRDTPIAGPHDRGVSARSQVEARRRRPHQQKAEEASARPRCRNHGTPSNHYDQPEAGGGVGVANAPTSSGTAPREEGPGPASNEVTRFRVRHLRNAHSLERCIGSSTSWSRHPRCHMPPRSPVHVHVLSTGRDVPKGQLAKKPLKAKGGRSIAPGRCV